MKEVSRHHYTPRMVEPITIPYPVQRERLRGLVFVLGSRRKPCDIAKGMIGAHLNMLKNWTTRHDTAKTLAKNMSDQNSKKDEVNTNQIVAIFILRARVADHKVGGYQPTTIITSPIPSRESELMIRTTARLMSLSCKVHRTIHALRTNGGHKLGLRTCQHQRNGHTRSKLWSEDCGGHALQV